MAKGWLDNYGKEDNYNDSSVSAPEGFQGDGYSNVGRNYSPAWGGQFQMGGSLPGATGHMYARIGAPSNGKYAKHTLASAQDGYQTGDKVKYGTPEYREAYNKGEVVTKEGEHSPILLDEVVVKGKKKDKNWLQQYADKIVDENKDAGVLGAILGTPISAVTSLPQLMGMKALTGEMERPSEALDVENPYSAAAVDIVADPANLIGAGVLTKEKALARLMASKEAGLLSRTHKLNPWAFKYNPEAYYRTLGKEGLEDAFESGVIRPKQTSNVYSPDLGKRINIDTPEFPEGAYFNKGEIYSTKKMYNPDYMTEVVGKDDVFKYPERTVFNKNIRVAPKDIPVEDAKFYKKHWLQGYKQIPKQEDGGVIKDDRGQWAHPGEITEINSNDITMEGVPYNVLGISDIGDTKLMKPGKNYKFKGKKVTEYPMAKNGVNQQDGKSLQQLDQLTNFTNYNTKQSGGWLDQY